MGACVKGASIQEKIRQDMFDLLSMQFGILLDKFQAKNKSHLWGIDGPLSPIEMVYLVHILEDKYSICFSEMDFEDPCFYTVDGLIHIIEQKCNL